MSNGFAFAKSRRFAPLFGTQFLGALNDNLFKTALFVMISYHGLGQSSWLPAEQMLNLGALLFILPFFLFSALSGQLCNKFDRGRMAVVIKLMEVAVMMLATVGFLAQSVWLLMGCLFLMGLQSTLFGPLKYAVLPDYLNEKELLSGNSLIEGGTFLAILFGQIIGTLLAGTGGTVVSTVVLVIAALGLCTSLFMPRVAAKAPQTAVSLHVVRDSKDILRQAFADRALYAAIIGISWFWFIGAVYTTQLPTFTRLHLGGNEAVFNLMLALFSIGIGSGSVLCAKLSHNRLNLGWVALGTVGMGIFGLLLVSLTHGQHHRELVGITTFLARSHAYPVMLCIGMLGFFGGFFSVPLYTWLQTASSETFRAHAVAANNIVNGLFMVAAALLSALLLWLFDSITLLYLMVAVGNVLMLGYLLWIAPEIREGIKRWIA
ncbi:MFS transporter [Neisseria shayeganii]|uniref:MFS transporter n=1 Tax=Neisseria shayeganii TaxID=607712 RepID=A0A7D7SID6_9NEIS|nr:MFS transporter [Neisseria shayeganii]QMT41472.1 MFS transporter [Neisseria shayeganii]